MERKEREHFKPSPKMSRNRQFLILSLFQGYFLLIALVSEPFPDILKGLYTIFTEPDILITDYIALGGIGAAFFNASILTFMCIGIIYLLKMEITGSAITSVFLMMGFSLFGKNIVNIWAILLGVVLYSAYHKEHLSKYIYVGFYGTSLSPIITEIIYIQELPSALSFLCSILIGMIMGFCLPPLSTHLFYAHKGFSLYNAGFSAGLIATIVVSVFKSYGMSVETRNIWSTGNNELFLQVLFGFFIILFVMGMVLEHGWDVFKKYRHILTADGIMGTNYIARDGLPATLINMAINGMFATVYVVAIGGELNGPTIGGIFTIVGFSATGKHLRNIAPIMIGVWLTSLTAHWNITDPSVILAALFSTTLAPIAGKYGIICGLIAGFLHASLALNIGLINSGMNLYNNGFAGGLIATFLVPIINCIEDRRARAREELI